MEAKWTLFLQKDSIYCWYEVLFFVCGSVADVKMTLSSNFTPDHFILSDYLSTQKLF